MVLGGQPPGRVGHRRTVLTKEPSLVGRLFRVLYLVDGPETGCRSRSGRLGVDNYDRRVNRPWAWVGLGLVAGLIAWAALRDTTSPLGPELGGEATVFDESTSAFATPIPSLSNEERRAFFVGNSFFNDNWVTAPAPTTGRDGLGPTFNAQSCSSCHFRDGRGVPPDDDPASLGLLLRISRGGGGPSEALGEQLQDRSINQVEAEGTIGIDYSDFVVELPGGGERILSLPHYLILDSPFEFEDDLVLSPRLAPQIAGVGLLEAIAESTILDRADPEDADNDGISGRPNYVLDLRSEELVLGRFGWKANTPSVEQQNASAFQGDIGITSSLIPAENCPPIQASCSEAPNGGEPELDDLKLDRVTFYAQALAVPARRRIEDSTVLRGQELFFQLGCESCHTATTTTGEGPLEQLSNQTIHPFTDLLLHDMGPGLADGRPDFEATGTEWRTPPLWGLGLIETVNRNARYLHDGRARTLDEAIMWHGGEAESARNIYSTLEPDQVEALIAFLKDL